jgi:hypothetical protein
MWEKFLTEVESLSQCKDTNYPNNSRDKKTESESPMKQSKLLNDSNVDNDNDESTIVC